MNWTVTGPNTAQARVRLRRSLAPGAPVVDMSDAVFTISGASVDVTDTAPPAAIAFSPAWPNPSRGPVRFELALPQAAPVMLEVHDVQGRRVASIARAEFPAGRHTITWEGRSHGGDVVPAGLYFVRMRAGAFEVTRQVVRIH
jgi:flagellar hook assembly protein FlgD